MPSFRFFGIAIIVLVRRGIRRLYYTWKLCFRFFNINQILGFEHCHLHEVYEKIESNFNVASVWRAQYLPADFLSRSEFTDERGHFALGGLAGAKNDERRRFKIARAKWFDASFCLRRSTRVVETARLTK